MRETCQQLFLLYVDKYWSRYLIEISDIREGIHLNRIGGKEPVFEFHKLAIEIFEKLQEDMERDMIQSFNRIAVKNNQVYLNHTGLKAPSSTWTYLVNDNPTEDMFLIQLSHDIGRSTGVSILWPLIVLYPLLKKIGRKNTGK